MTTEFYMRVSPACAWAQAGAVSGPAPPRVGVARVEQLGLPRQTVLDLTRLIHVDAVVGRVGQGCDGEQAAEGEGCCCKPDLQLLHCSLMIDARVESSDATEQAYNTNGGSVNNLMFSFC